MISRVSDVWSAKRLGHRCAANRRIGKKTRNLWKYENNIVIFAIVSVIYGCRLIFAHTHRLLPRLPIVWCHTLLRSPWRKFHCRRNPCQIINYFVPNGELMDRERICIANNFHLLSKRFNTILKRRGSRSRSIQKWYFSSSCTSWFI